MDNVTVARTNIVLLPPLDIIWAVFDCLEDKRESCQNSLVPVSLNNASDYQANGLMLGLGLVVRYPDSPMHC